MDLSNENVIHVKKDGLEYIQFRKLLEYQNIITHAYTLGTNLNFRTAKANKEKLPENEFIKAVENYKKICNALKTDYTHIVKTNQEHTDNVVVVRNKINISEPDINMEEYSKTDGLVTNKTNIMLSTTNADCILFLMFDPIKKVIANVHSGWKGTLQKISLNAIDKMENIYNCNPEDIICCICPSIRKCHFEVEEDVMQMFYDKFKTIGKIDEIIKFNKNKNKWNIDTVLINKIILQTRGLNPENIIDSGICSVCNSDMVHSFRVEKEGYGLATALIELK